MIPKDRPATIRTATAIAITSDCNAKTAKNPAKIDRNDKTATYPKTH